MVVEIRMIQWMCGYTRPDRIRNVVTRYTVGVAPIEDKISEMRLRWFGHVKRSVHIPVIRYENINLTHFRRER